MNSAMNLQHNPIEAAELLLLGGGEEEELHFPSSDFYFNDNNFMINTNSSFSPNTFHLPTDQNLSFLQQEFNQNDDFYNINNLLFPATPSSTSSSANFPSVFGPNDYKFNNYSLNNCTKRQKISSNHYIMNNPCSDFASFNQYPCSNYGFYPPNPNPHPPIPSLPQFLPELNFLQSNIIESAAAASMPSALQYLSGNKKENSDGCLSAQSVAARQRRRKITEKTQQLGKLIPGVENNKLNTAEMFQAAFKYVKFLQAQVGTLELMQPYQQGNKEDNLCISMNMKGLLTSQTVQEKLYSEEKCLVSNEFVQVLANDEEIKNSEPLISNELDSLFVVKHSEN